MQSRANLGSKFFSLLITLWRFSNSSDENLLICLLISFLITYHSESFSAGISLFIACKLEYFWTFLFFFQLFRLQIQWFWASSSKSSPLASAISAWVCLHFPWYLFCNSCPWYYWFCNYSRLCVGGVRNTTNKSIVIMDRRVAPTKLYL